MRAHLEQNERQHPDTGSDDQEWSGHTSMERFKGRSHSLGLLEYLDTVEDRG